MKENKYWKDFEGDSQKGFTKKRTNRFKIKKL